MKDRLFVPLNTRPFEAFASGTKEIEVRGISDRFHEGSVFIGRRVELRRGYAYESIWGTITDRWVSPDLEDLFDEIAWGLDDLDDIRDVVGEYRAFIAFRIDIDDDEIV